jgi:uncharacterized membrane protein
MNTVLTDQMLTMIRDAIAAIGVFVICVGGVRGLYQLFMLYVYEKFDTAYIRLQFGDSVILGLEFMVGADIIGSLVEPDYYNLGLLGIIVVIRTVLSFFLNYELQTLSPMQRKAIK